MLTKKALIRDPSVPIGQPGPMHLNCCGHEILLDAPFDGSAKPVQCPVCATSYKQTGHVICGWIEQPAISPDWPYPDMVADWEAQSNCWRETTRNVYLDQLGAVPPDGYHKHGFLVGEPYTHTEDDAVHACFLCHLGRYYGRLVRVKQWKALADALINTLEHQ